MKKGLSRYDSIDPVTGRIRNDDSRNFLATFDLQTDSMSIADCTDIGGDLQLFGFPLHDHIILERYSGHTPNNRNKYDVPGWCWNNTRFSQFIDNLIAGNPISFTYYSDGMVPEIVEYDGEYLRWTIHDGAWKYLEDVQTTKLVPRYIDIFRLAHDQIAKYLK